MALIDAYGARADRWPAAERARAHACLARSAAARSARAEAARLDALLDQAPKLKPSPAVIESTLADAPKPAGFGRTAEGHLKPPGRRVPLWPSVAMAASAAFGILVGVTTTPLQGPDGGQLGLSADVLEDLAFATSSHLLLPDEGSP